MAPVTVAGAPKRGKAPQWTPESVITEIQHFVQAHGEVPRLADFNPGQAKITGQVWRIERYRAGCPVCGSPYPSANAARRCFGGSLEKAIRAAGFEPAKRGPKRRAEIDLSARATERLAQDAKVAVEAALARAADAEARAERLQAQLDRARARAAAAPKIKTKVVRERVADAAALARVQRKLETAEGRAASAKAELAEAKMDAAEARRTAAKLASRLERAEATITDARAAKREAHDALAEAARAAARAEERVNALERELVAARAAAVPVAAAPARVERVIESAPERAELEAALERARRAEDATRRAEARAARAEREYAEVAVAATGEPRKLTPAELDALRSDGPAGPALLADAIKGLAAARRTNDRLRLDEALAQIASAAITWRDRL